MREDITSIPVSEVFEPKEGCPVCRMRDLLETRVVDYITGAAMMEPDVRIETNRQGFCITHYRMQLQKRNRLGVALMMQSRLDEVEKQVFAGGVPLLGKSGGKKAKAAAEATDGCFVCQQVDWAMERMLATVCRLWENERDFRELFEQQEGLCLPHFALLCRTAETKMSKKNIGDFEQTAAELSRKTLEGLREDVAHFCKMFDYRSGEQGMEWGNARDSVERAVDFLSGRKA